MNYNKKKFLPLMVLLMMILSGVLAQAQLYPIKIYRDTLSNGLEVIYSIDKSAPLVATVMYYKVGSKDELSSQTGYAHFFEHLMFEATDNIPRASIDKFVQEAGGNLNAETSFDQTVYYFELPANQLKLALWIESQRIRKLKVESAGVETQRGVVLEEMKQSITNQPYGTLLQKTMENLFGTTSYGWDVIGYEKNIASATIEQFQTFYNNYYQTNNATLVIVGDFDLIETKKLVESYFGGYPRGAEIKKTIINLPPLKKGYKETFHDDKVMLPGIFISYRGPSVHDSDYYATSLLTDILANGESSRLYQRLVDKEQIAAEAAVMPMPLQQAGAIIFYGISSPGKSIEDVEEVMKEEIGKVIKSGVSADELQKAKNITETNFISSKKDVLSKAKAIAEYNGLYGKPNMINTELEKYLSVTVDDIKKAAKKYLSTDKMVTLIYLPKEK